MKKEKSKNPLDAIQEIFEKQVERSDKKGFSEMFKRGTEKLFNHLKKFHEEYRSEESVGFTFDDIEYLDGYFIFGTGTNSVANFKIKEAPGWKFGIWWEPIIDEKASTKRKKVYLQNKVKATVFGQYEANIDKFKPSRSEFCEEYTYYTDEDECLYALEVYEMISFIEREPDLAFYRDYTGTDFNKEFVSREKARNFKKKKEAWRIENDRLEDEFAHEACRRIKYDLLADVFKDGDAFIIDQGDYTSPRYEIIVKADDDFEKDIKKEGYNMTSVYIGNLIEKDEDGEYIIDPIKYKEYKKWENKFDRDCKKKNHYMVTCGKVSDFIEVCTSEFFNEVYEEAKKNGTLFEV